MSNINNPPSDFDPSSPHRIRIPPVYPDSHDENKEMIDLPTRIESVIWATLLQEIDKKLNGLIKKKKKTELGFKELYAALTNMRDAFQHLSHKDVSADSHFATNLSNNWHTIVTLVAEEETRRTPSPFLGFLKIFIQKLNNYPKNNNYSLGFYLTEYAGEEWLPLPFIDLLRKLHEEALINKAKSHLLDWSYILTDILDSLE